MKIYNLTAVGFFLGLVTQAYSVYRYLIRYDDPSQALIFVGFGLGIWALAYIHNELKIAEFERKENKKEDEEYRMSAEDMYNKLLTRVSYLEERK